MKIQDLTPFQKAYIEAALWSSTDDEDEPLDKNYGVEDIAPEALVKIVADCEKFQADNAELIGRSFCIRELGEWPKEELVGHDFWLTRNHHGTGFWDGDWRAAEGDEKVGDKLTEAAHAFGECDLYVGDDKKLYI